MAEKDYRTWWENWYSGGGTAGPGSYGLLAEFKAEVVNQFIAEQGLESVIEFGCGDGNQLRYMNYRKYLGLDISKAALDICMSKFSTDKGKSFLLYDPNYFVNNGTLEADLVVCLDVLYHITDEKDYRKTFADILSCARKYVVLYTILDSHWINNPHTVFWDIFRDLEAYPEFEVAKIVPQRFREQSAADFVIIARKGSK